MRHPSVILIVIITSVIAMSSSDSAYAQGRAPKISEMLASDATLGLEYWIAIPPNEINPFPVDELEIYVASAYETEIEVFDASRGTTIKRKLMPYEIRTLSDKRGETNWSWEVRDTEQVVRKGIRIIARKPISVYVLNSKVTTTDGYMAIPVSAWGTEYVATTYYDFREFKQWGGGFIVVGREGGTEVTIQLRGVGANEAKTSGGRSLNGQPFTVLLDEGDVYMVKGDATTRGVFDLTGSKITSNRPIGLISFHERTTMPNLLINGNGRNHLAEMTPPTSTWGKRYASLELQRENRNGQGKGDVFRVIARDSNTTWSLKYYDRQSKKPLGQQGGLIAKAGEFFELAQATAPTTLTHGYAVWEADKPIFVMQYSCSSSWDGDPILDPFMMNVTPEEQFVTSAIFQCPTSAKFSKNRVNLIVKTDTASPELMKNLESLEIDGIPVWRHPSAQSPTLKFNKMPGGLYWTTLDFGAESRAHRITSNGAVKFGGYVYGYGAVDAYGWPIISAGTDLRFIDTMPPVISRTQECGTFTCEVSELRNIPDPPRSVPMESDQIEAGIALIDTMPGAGNVNYKLELLTDQSFPRVTSYKKFKYALKVINPNLDARCVYFVRDWAGNQTLDTCEYSAPRFQVDQQVVDFGKTRLQSKVERDVTVRNSLMSDLVIRACSLKRGARFAIVRSSSSLPAVLQAGDSLVITLRYDAAEETTDLTRDFDVDTLIISSTCASTSLPVRGLTAEPRIDIEDFDAGTVDPGVTSCKPGGLRISNLGSDTLTITGITGYEGSNFRLSSSVIQALPYRIAPKASFQVLGVCYRRSDVGADSVRAEFQSDASGPKVYSIWRGSTVTTSVDDDQLTSVVCTSTPEGINVAWDLSNVATVRAITLRGEVLASASVTLDVRNVLLRTNDASQQVVLVHLCDAAGAVVYQRKVVLR